MANDPILPIFHGLFRSLSLFKKSDSEPILSGPERDGLG